MKNARSGNNVRKPGDFFEEITGRKVSDCPSICDIGKAIEEALGRTLKVRSFGSNLVPCQSVFPLSSNDIGAINRELDALLKNRPIPLTPIHRHSNQEVLNMEQAPTKSALELATEAERNIAREVVMMLSRDVLLQGGDYITAEDIEADRKFMREYTFRYPQKAKGA